MPRTPNTLTSHSCPDRNAVTNASLSLSTFPDDHRKRVARHVRELVNHTKQGTTASKPPFLCAAWVTNRH